MPDAFSMHVELSTVLHSHSGLHIAIGDPHVQCGQVALLREVTYVNTILKRGL